MCLFSLIVLVILLSGCYVCKQPLKVHKHVFGIIAIPSQITAYFEVRRPTYPFMLIWHCKGEGQLSQSVANGLRAIMCVHVISLVFCTVHYWTLSVDGKGTPFMTDVSVFLDAVTQVNIFEGSLFVGESWVIVRFWVGNNTTKWSHAARWPLST